VSIGNAQADMALDWQGLIDATEMNPDLLPSVAPEVELLSGQLGNFKVLKARQQDLTAQRQETTQQLNEVVARGKETATTIRAVLRGKVGPWNERLVQFNIAPIRRRPRKPVEVNLKKPANEVRTEPVVKVPSPADPVA
jgi:hypothetical protein